MAQAPEILSGSRGESEVQLGRPTGMDGSAIEPVYRTITRILSDQGFLLEYYQRAAVLRRVHRRMQALSLPTLEDYATFLEASASEASELIREVSRPQGLLFRDVTVIESLASLLPERLRAVQRPQIWVPACGSGEEAYATAMILDALLGAAGIRKDFVVYGTDTDREALRAAQRGAFQFPAAERVPAHLSEYHLGLVDGELRVVSDLKNHCLFMAHDVADAPPFFDLDLIVCRNLLHFLQAPLQRHMLERLAGALRPGGLLFMGRMETPIDHPDLFRPMPSAPGLYQRAETIVLDEPGSGDVNRLRSDNLHAAIFRSMPVPLMVLDSRFSFVEANPAAITVLGERAAEILGRELTEWVEQADQSRLQEAFQALTRERSVHLDLTLRDGRAVELVLSRVPGHPGRVLVQTVAAGDDRLRSRLAQTARRADAMLRQVNDAVIFVDSANLIVEFNEEAQRLTGWARNEALDQPLDKVLSLVSFTRGVAEIPLPLDTSTRQRYEDDAFLQHIGGRRTAVSVRSTPIPDGGGAVIVIEDIGERMLLREELAYRASHDPITGLLNRDEFEARARAAHTEVRRGGKTTVLAYIDIDQFKLINDTLGHTAGDELLHDLSSELRAQLGESDSLARLGGDEFGVLLPGRGAAEARPVIEALVEAARRFRFQWAGRSYALTVSVGACVIDAGSDNVTQAMSEADAACFAAKDAGRNRICFAGPGEELSRRYADMSRASQLGRALDEDRFMLYFEDVVSVAQPDRVVYRELLVRVRDERGSLVAPGGFIQAAERFSMMTALDRWVLRDALRGIARLPRDGIIYAINLSGQSLSDENFLDYVLAELIASRVDPQRLCFEITETAAVSRLTEAVRFVDRLTEAGCRFALDDFGVGMASFSYLKNFPVDFLKIDGSFVGSMASSRADRGMVETINRIGHELGLRTIAEHVESMELLETLRTMGVDLAQGRGITMARPFEELVRPG